MSDFRINNTGFSWDKVRDCTPIVSTFENLYNLFKDCTSKEKSQEASTRLKTSDIQVEKKPRWMLILFAIPLFGNGFAFYFHFMRTPQTSVINASEINENLDHATKDVKKAMEFAKKTISEKWEGLRVGHNAAPELAKMIEKHPCLEEHEEFFHFAIEKTLEVFFADGHAYVDTLVGKAGPLLKKNKEFFFKIIDKLSNLSSVSSYPFVCIESVIKKADSSIRDSLTEYYKNAEKQAKEPIENQMQSAEITLKKLNTLPTHEITKARDQIKEILQKQPRLRKHVPFFRMVIEEIILNHFITQSHAYLDEIVGEMDGSLKKDINFFYRICDKALEKLGLNDFFGNCMSRIIEIVDPSVQDALKNYVEEKKEQFKK